MTPTTPTTPDVPPVRRSITVPVDQDHAFTAFTDQIAAWWPTPTHGAFGAACGRIAFEDGRLIERATDGAAIIWGEVLAWEPPRLLSFTWHPGGGPDEASQVDVLFVAVEGGTRVELEHRGWERFGQAAAARRRRYVGPGAWGAVLEHYADVAEAATDHADMAPLAAAYEEFFAEADRGGFGPPPPGEWDAAQVLAHVTLNDYAIVAVTQSIIHQAPIRFENVVCQDRTVLAAHIGRFGGDLAALAAHGRQAAATVRDILGRLDADQRATLIACRLLHDGQVVLDAELPWDQVADALQRGRHLPAHVEQLRQLRVGVGRSSPGTTQP
ncbi:MAG: SRPBCC domain-containing protein [Tetrasphaera sp.]|nr:SRPBCC domain-containing protein [Tetrasphaera sp.]